MFEIPLWVGIFVALMFVACVAAIVTCIVSLIAFFKLRGKHENANITIPR